MIDASACEAEYLAALRAGDRRRAFAVIDGACAAAMELGAIYLSVLQPAMREIGRLWQINELTVAEEHLATAITQMVMARLYMAMIAPIEAGERTLIAACAETERHEVGLRMICDLLERDGWNVTYLGACVPRESLVTMVQQRRPDAVILSATIAPHLPALRAAIHAVREAMGDATPFLVAGGRPFLDDAGLAQRLGADATAPDAREVVARMRERFA